MSEPANQRTLSFAYGGYLACGLVAMVGSIGEYAPMRPEARAGFGLLVVMPLLPVAATALLLAAFCTVWSRGNAELWVMLALTAVVGVNFFTESFPVQVDRALPLVYGSFCCALSIRWFISKRRTVRGLKGRTGAQ